MFELTAIPRGETDGVEQCHWVEAENGRTYVPDISSADDTKRNLTRPDGFELVPVTCRVLLVKYSI